MNTIATKLAHVMGQVDGMPEDELIPSIRSALAAQGVAVFPSLRKHTVETIVDERGKRHHARVVLELTFIDGETGDQHTITWVGAGVDLGEKSYVKAYQDAFRQAITHTFLVEVRR